MTFQGFMSNAILRSSRWSYLPPPASPLPSDAAVEAGGQLCSFVCTNWRCVLPEGSNLSSDSTFLKGRFAERYCRFQQRSPPPCLNQGNLLLLLKFVCLATISSKRFMSLRLLPSIRLRSSWASCIALTKSCHFCRMRLDR